MEIERELNELYEEINKRLDEYSKKCKSLQAARKNSPTKELRSRILQEKTIIERLLMKQQHLHARATERLHTNKVILEYQKRFPKDPEVSAPTSRAENLEKFSFLRSGGLVTRKELEKHEAEMVLQKGVQKGVEEGDSNSASSSEKGKVLEGDEEGEERKKEGSGSGGLAGLGRGGSRSGGRRGRPRKNFTSAMNNNNNNNNNNNGANGNGNGKRRDFHLRGERIRDEYSSDSSTHDDYCSICHIGGSLLLCESCPKSFHIECLDPPLSRVPEGRWFCPTCAPPSRELHAWSPRGSSSRSTDSSSSPTDDEEMDGIEGVELVQLSSGQAA